MGTVKIPILQTGELRPSDSTGELDISTSSMAPVPGLLPTILYSLGSGYYFMCMWTKNFKGHGGGDESSMIGWRW